MPLPLILIGIAALSGLFGAKKGVDAYKHNKDASKVNTKANSIFRDYKNECLQQKSETTKILEILGKQKLNIWSNQMSRFIRLFEQIKNVEIIDNVKTDSLKSFYLDETQLSQIKVVSLNAKEIMGGGLASLSSGALVGVASYGLTMTLASASTGTAIASLTGVAATNATLAWLGGGSLAAGGMGIAGGTLVLGGLVFGPALAVGGVFMDAKARKKLAQAKINLSNARKAATELSLAITILKGIGKTGQNVIGILDKLIERFDPLLDTLETLIKDKGTNYQKYDDLGKHKVYLNVQIVQVLKTVLETPILKEDGSQNNKSELSYKGAKEFLAQNEE